MTPHSHHDHEHRERHSEGHHRHHRRPRKRSVFSKIGAWFQSIGGILTGTSGQRHHRIPKPRMKDRLKARFEEFKTEFTPPERLKKGVIKHEPFRKRFRTWLKGVKSDLFTPRLKMGDAPKPKLSVRMGMKLDDMKEDLKFKRLVPKVGDHIPRKAKLAYLRDTKWKQYRVIFSKEFLIISLNSLILFLTAFYTVHFLTQIITGIVCHLFDIQTELYYATTEFHFTIQSIIEGQILMNKWTLLEIIVVFAAAPVACLMLGVLLYQLLNMKRIKFSFKRMFRKFIYMFAGKQKRQELKMQESEKSRGRKINLSGHLRLFLIWFICHAFTYFFSGMLFSWLFFMRFGYVTGYIFDSYFFDNLAASLSLISMVLLGFLFVSLFLHSSRMYFNQLVDWTRMPFVINQIVIPTLIGLPIIVITMLPKIIMKIGVMQVCMVILILPLLWRGRMYPEVQFDYKPRTIRINWKWLISGIVISGAMITALKIGISI